MERINALSIDVEDWYHPELVRNRAGESPPPLIKEATLPILHLLDQYRTKASFFILGEVAEKNPDLVRSIFQRGHEIGCHGFSHKPLWKLDKELFREELKRCHSVLERILGSVKIKGFRAPTFSLDHRTQWAVQVLIEEGYQYDASIFPVKLNRLYGIDGAPTQPYQISLKDVAKEDSESPLLEFPMPLLNVGRLKIPISGGFYLRILPLPFLLWGLKRINSHQPFLLYFHPWEGYEKTPKLDLPLYNRLISYYGIGAAMKKLESILKHFRLTRVDEVLGLG
jgi:polysaccharide deacetylase family protein (PEP-CTERM system associated)